MDKISLTDVTFLIPLRPDSLERIENVIAVVSFLHEHFDTRIMVLEASPYENHLFTSLVREKAEYRHVEDRDAVFHRTKYINLLAGKATTPVIAIWDADVIVELSGITDAVNSLRSNGSDMAYPYDGRLLDTSEIIREQYLRQPAIETLRHYFLYMNPMYGNDAKNGAVFVNVEKYRQAGMDDESIYGTGNEDIERYYRFWHKGFQIYRSSGVACHLSHPRDENGKCRTRERFNVAANAVKRTVNALEKEERLLSVTGDTAGFRTYRIVLPERTVAEKPLKISNIEIEDITQSKIGEDLKINADIYCKHYGFKLSLSEIQNYAAHRAAWQHFMQSDAQWCLIVESNVTLQTGVETFLNPVAELPPDWEVFIPYTKETMKQKTEKKSHGMSLQNDNTREYDRPEPYLLRYKFGNSIYFLSRKGARKLLETDTVTDRLDHTFLNMGNLKLYMKSVDWFEVGQIEDYEWTDRNELILQSAIERCGWTDDRLQRARELLKTVGDTGMANNMDLMLDAGTLLACVRHGGIMLWDDDFDIGIEEKHLPLFFQEIEKHENLRYEKSDFWGTTFYRIWDVRGEVTENVKHTFPLIDIWPFVISDGHIIYRNRNIYFDAAGQPFKTVSFEGVAYKIPANPVAVLDSRYSDWRNTVRVYPLSHRLEILNFKYICIPIKTDENGRFTGVV
jgi:GR25 family glycosyltransferase involved in LPS biosynthesis